MKLSHLIAFLFLATPLTAQTSSFDTSIHSLEGKADHRFSFEALISSAFESHRVDEDLFPRFGLGFFSPRYQDFWSWGLAASYLIRAGNDYSLGSKANLTSAQATSFDESLVGALLFVQLQPHFLSVGGLNVFSRNGFETNLSIQHSNSVRETKFEIGGVFLSSIGLSFEPEFLIRSARSGWEFLIPRGFQMSYSFRYLSQADLDLNANSLDFGIWFSL